MASLLAVKVKIVAGRAPGMLRPGSGLSSSRGLIRTYLACEGPVQSVRVQNPGAHLRASRGCDDQSSSLSVVNQARRG